MVYCLYPYQAEIAQGRSKVLLNYQTMVSDLTAMPLPMHHYLMKELLLLRPCSCFLTLEAGKRKKQCQRLLVSEDCFPQTVDVLKTRSNPVGITLHTPHSEFDFLNSLGMLIQVPSKFGQIDDYTVLSKDAKNNDVGVSVAAVFLA